MAAQKAGQIIKNLQSKLLIGTCLPTLKHNATKVRVRTLELDEFLLRYFKQFDNFYAYDPEKICKVGDIVLIKPMHQKITTTITHEIVEVVYPLGDITDPITGEKVIKHSYRRQIEELDSKFGKLPTAFDYKKAPPRGWQEGKKDFSEKETFIKYHDFPEDDEGNDPYGYYK